MKSEEAAKTKIDRVGSRMVPIMASKDGSLPARIEVLKVGVWRTPYHGDFMITPEDLEEYVQHFNEGVGLVSAGIGAPIDFSHDNHKEAAGWMTKLYVEEDSLMADVEWSDAGKEALLGKRFKCFSPEFYPKGRGGWCDPEDYEHFVDNVLVGGGLTNIPLFKDLTPIMASQSSSERDGGREKNIILLHASAKKETSMPTLDEVLAKEKDALTNEERNLLVENKAKLTADQLNKFGMEPDQTPAPESKVDNQQVVTASQVKGDEGNVLMAASEVADMRRQIEKSKDLEKDVESLKRDKVTASVNQHLARGAIKADRVSNWVDRIMADATMEDELKALPDNAVMAAEQGKTNGADATRTMIDELKERTLKVQASAKAEGKDLTYGQAQDELFRTDPEFKNKYEASKQKGNE